MTRLLYTYLGVRIGQALDPGPVPAGGGTDPGCHSNTNKENPRKSLLID